jgi:hypothetical protein
LSEGSGVDVDLRRALQFVDQRRDPSPALRRMGTAGGRLSGVVSSASISARSKGISTPALFPCRSEPAMEVHGAKFGVLISVTPCAMSAGTHRAREAER